MIAFNNLEVLTFEVELVIASAVSMNPQLKANRIRAIAGRTEDVLDRIRDTPWDAIILDPPRDGCAPEVLQAVFEDLRPPLVIYVSCNPEALAAELPQILDAGYRVDDLKAVDMFPHTDHIEALVTLSRRAR